MSGLPGRLPAGESLLWQGKPAFRVLARRVFHLRLLTAYFGVLLVWSAVGSFSRGVSPGQLAVSALQYAGLAAIPVALLALYAWGVARSTTYTITSRRVVIRFGVALPLTVNLPYARIDAAGFRAARDGSGDIALQPASGERLSYVVLWPHVRPLGLRRPEPMLRALPDAGQAAQILSRALAASADTLPAAIGQLQPDGHTGTIQATRAQPA